MNKLLILIFLLFVLVGCSAEPQMLVTEPFAPAPKPAEPPEEKTLPPPPVIEYFQVAPDRIGLGSSIVLSWYVSGATTIFLDHEIGNVAMTGAVEVYPDISTTYTLTAVNEGATVNPEAMVIVVPAKAGLPIINSFAADPGNITVGITAVLSWNVTNAESVEIDPGVGIFGRVGTGEL